MTDSTHPRRNGRPFASARFWWFGGDFWGVRYEAAFGIHVLELPSSRAPDSLQPVEPPEAEAGPSRIQIEGWEEEGGAVGE